jgi:hypothetical protein
MKDKLSMVEHTHDPNTPRQDDHEFEVSLKKTEKGRKERRDGGREKKRKITS